MGLGPDRGRPPETLCRPATPGAAAKMPIPYEFRYAGCPGALVRAMHLERSSARATRRPTARPPHEMEHPMTTTKLLALLLLPGLLGTGCVHSYAHSRTWGEEPYGAPPPQQTWERTGRVSNVRETVYEQHGDPAGGAVAGAIVGGLLGSAITGGRGGGALVGAIGGAAVGANASQGSARQTVYEVTIRFDDGGVQTYAFRGYLPFRPGDDVRLTPQGLSRL